MRFLKKHYEKVILSIVLLGLVAVAAAIPYKVSQVRESLEETKSKVKKTPPKAFQPVNLTTNETTLRRFAGSIKFDLSDDHTVFNPARWEKRPNGSLAKLPSGRYLGPGALVVNRIAELSLIVSFDNVAVTGTPENPRYNYGFVVVRETDPSPRKTQIAMLGQKNSLFTLNKVEGPLEAPTEMLLVLRDENQAIRVTKGQPFRRVVGYAAELEYPPRRQKFPRLFKVKDSLKLDGDPESYKIVAIDASEVVLSAESTQKRTSIKWTRGAQADSGAGTTPR